MITRAQEIYAEAMQIQAMADKYATNVEFWSFVHKELQAEESQHTADAGWYRSVERDILKKCKRNLKMHKKLTKKADKLFKSYYNIVGT